MGFAYYSPSHWIEHERGKKLAALSVAGDGEVEMLGVDVGEQGLVSGPGQELVQEPGQGPGRQRPRQRRYHHDVEGLFQQVCCLQPARWHGLQ